MVDILEKLVGENLISANDEKKIREEVKKSGKSPEEVIFLGGFLSEDDLFNFKSKITKFPLKKVNPDKINQSVLAVIPKESAEFYKIIPLAINKENKILEVGMVFPENSQAEEAIKFLARQEKLSLKVYLIRISDFKKCFQKYQIPEKEMQNALEELEKESRKEETGTSSRDFSRLVEDAPVVKMVAVILRQAIEGRASDIHIEPTRKNLRVRYRMDGILYASLFLPLRIHPAIIARIKILSGLKIDETRMPQDGRFSTKFNDKRIDFRVSTFPTGFGEKVAIRVLDPEKGLKSPDDLGLNPRNLRVLKSAIGKPYGMILTTGPTGCGKSTTLYAILRSLNKDKVNIVTLEDPIEYFIEGINQSQVKPEINYTFARGLRQILRQDPDIIMVGEIRDSETASLAIHAALTGHLVLSTIHTTSAVGVVPRLIDMGIKQFLIAPTLNLVMSQRLVRVLCPYCKKKVRLESEKEKYVREKLKNIPKEALPDIDRKGPLYAYEPVGCKKCNYKGYSGRVALFEMIEMTPELANIINENPTNLAILKEARRQKMVTMEEDGVIKALQGITSIEEVMRVIEEE